MGVAGDGEAGNGAGVGVAVGGVVGVAGGGVVGLVGVAGVGIAGDGVAGDGFVGVAGAGVEVAGDGAAGDWFEVLVVVAVGGDCNNNSSLQALAPLVRLELEERQILALSKKKKENKALRRDWPNLMERSSQ